MLIYFGDPGTKEALDAMAAEDGLTRAQMIASLVQSEAHRRRARKNKRPA